MLYTDSNVGPAGRGCEIRCRPGAGGLYTRWSRSSLSSRGSLLITVLMAIVALGFAVGMVIDLYFRDTVAHEEEAYRERLIAIRRAVDRFLMMHDWSELMNEDQSLLSYDDTLGKDIPGYDPPGGPDAWMHHRIFYSIANIDQPLVEFGQTNHRYIVLGCTTDPSSYNPSSASPFARAQSSFASIVGPPPQLDTLDRYKVVPNTIKFLRRLIRTGYLNMSEEDVMKPWVTIFPRSNAVWMGVPRTMNPPMH